MSCNLFGYERHNIYMAYDNDEPGVKASTYFNKTYGFNYFNVPREFISEGIKDWADLVQQKGLETMENYLKSKGLII